MRTKYVTRRQNVLVRGAGGRMLLVLAVVTAAVAAFASVDGVLEHREAASSARAARDYAGIAYAAGRQQRLVAAPGNLSRKGRIQQDARLTEHVGDLLADLASRTQGEEAAKVAALATSYGTAAKASALALRQAPSAARGKTANRAVTGFDTVKAQATRSLRDRQTAVLLSPPATAVDLAKAVAPLLTAAGALFVLCLVPVRRRRERMSVDGDRVKLEEAARTDNLTGLGNHRAFHHDLGAEIHRRAATGSVFALMALDLDGLKQINDTQGHQAGDRYIERICDVLRKTTAGQGTVYRVGGDEFMVLLPGMRNWDALALAQKIDQATRAAVKQRALSIGLTESIGPVARHLLIHQADLALYEAKRTKLTAVTYHAGLTSALEAAAEGPSQHQKALAAALARAVDAKDIGTRSHSETVAELCVGMGQRLGIEGDGLERLRLAGLLHDVGKIGVSDMILQKPSALATNEQDEMREHVSIGHGILISAELPIEAEWVLHHHERVDGAGYPTRLRGDDIPLQSRIIAVADAFEAMTGTRPYRSSITTAEALSELSKHIGSQFDGRCVHALVEVVDQEAATTAAAALTVHRARVDAAPGAVSAPGLATT
jgi:diguanylate cyclase (GGDEF)-like protein